MFDQFPSDLFQASAVLSLKITFHLKTKLRFSWYFSLQIIYTSKNTIYIIYIPIDVAFKKENKGLCENISENCNFGVICKKNCYDRSFFQRMYGNHIFNRPNAVVRVYRLCKSRLILGNSSTHTPKEYRLRLNAMGLIHENC